MSAGQIGCVESDVQISEGDWEFGGGQTWVATCAGVRFICGQVVTGGGGDPKHSSYDSQVNCTEELKSARREAAPATAVAAPAPERPAVKAPVAAGGFRLGSGREEAAATCTDANFEFIPLEPNGARCSGLPTGLAFNASAELSLCGDSVCGIALLADPALAASAQLKSYWSVSKALIQKYGKPQKMKSMLPYSCSEEPAIQACLDQGSADLSQSWYWPQVNIHLMLGKGGNVKNDRAQLRVLYKLKQPEKSAL